MIAAIITPPDVVSQLMLLVPMILRIATDVSQPWHLQLALILAMLFCITIVMARTYGSALGQAITLKARTDGPPLTLRGDHIAEEFHALVEIADHYDVLIGVEPELANIVSTALKARTLIDSLRSDRIRIVLDPANLAEVAPAEQRRAVIGDAVTLLADRIVMAHAKDRNADGSFATAGKGVVDFPHFLGALVQAGFDGSLVTHGLAAEEAAGVAAYLKSVLG